jgi:hypothetical protein
MKRWISLFAVALSVATATLFNATPAQANWFRYPGRSCGPDQRAVIWTNATGSGYINGQYAYYRSDGGISFSSLRHGTGSRSTVTPRRTVDSYDLVAGGGARLVSHGVSCQ